MGSHDRMYDTGSRMIGSSSRIVGSSSRMMGSSPGRMSSRGIGNFDDGADDEYDARKTAYRMFMANPTKYSHERHSEHRGGGIGDYDDPGYNEGRGGDKGPVSVVVEHSHGCTSQSVCDNLRDSIKLNFPEVKFREVYGRHGSFEVFLNGKLLYSRITQGGYPYEDEVLDSIDSAKRGEYIHQLTRGSYTCTIL